MSDLVLRPGGVACRCSACGEFFLSVRAFDRHRVGRPAERVCETTPRMSGAGLEIDSRGYWRLPRREPPQRKPRLAGRGELQVVCDERRVGQRAEDTARVCGQQTQERADVETPSEAQ
jgi:hypothetical protein